MHDLDLTQSGRMVFELNMRSAGGAGTPLDWSPQILVSGDGAGNSVRMPLAAGPITLTIAAVPFKIMKRGGQLSCLQYYFGRA
jgi:hypothetical protein